MVLREYILPTGVFLRFLLALLLKTVPVPALLDHHVMAGTKKLNGSSSLTWYDSLECFVSQIVRPMITSIDALVQVLAMVLRKLPGFPLPH